MAATPILAGLAVVLMLMMVNISVGNGGQASALVKLQAGRETALRTENAVWLLDKAASRAIYKEMDRSTCSLNRDVDFDDYFNENVLDELESEYGIRCAAIDTKLGRLSTDGKVECSYKIGEAEFAKTQDFSFEKRIETVSTVDGTECEVWDVPSNSREQP